MGLIDAHCHLYSFPNIEDVVLHACDSGVTSAIVVAEDIVTMEKTLRVRDRFKEFVMPGLGIHPVNMLRMDQDEWEKAIGFLRSHAHEISCIGEIGLDYKYAKTEAQKEWQKEALHAQMDIASENRLPVNLHSRRALRQTMEEAITFHRKTGLNALLHWFAHSRKLIKRTNEEEIFISVGPSILFSDEALGMALSIDPGLILIETDAPVPFNGKISHPAMAAKVAEKIISNYPEDQITFKRLAENTRRYLAPPASK